MGYITNINQWDCIISSDIEYEIHNSIGNNIWEAYVSWISNGKTSLPFLKMAYTPEWLLYIV